MDIKLNEMTKKEAYLTLQSLSSLQYLIKVRICYDGKEEVRDEYNDIVEEYFNPKLYPSHGRSVNESILITSSLYVCKFRPCFEGMSSKTSLGKPSENQRGNLP